MKLKNSILLLLLLIPLASATSFEMSYQGRVRDLAGAELTKEANVTIEINETNLINIYNETWVNGVHAIGDTYGFDVIVGRNKPLKTIYNRNYTMCIYINNQLQGSCYEYNSGIGLITSESMNLTTNMTINGTFSPEIHDAFDLGINNTNEWRYGFFSRDIFARNLFLNDILVSPGDYIRNGTDVTFKHINASELNVTGNATIGYLRVAKPPNGSDSVNISGILYVGIGPYNYRKVTIGSSFSQVGIDLYIKHDDANTSWVGVDSNQEVADANVGGFRGYWDKTELSRFGFVTYGDPANKGGGMRIHTKEIGVAGLPERVRIDDTGRVGIGTTTPESQLSVIGKVNITNNLTVGKSIYSKKDIRTGPSFNDSTKINRTATNNKATRYNTQFQPSTNGALNFSGVDQWLATPLVVAGQNGFTMCVWANLTDHAAQRTLAGQQVGLVYEFAILSGGTGELRFGGATDGQDAFRNINFGPISENAWEHLCVVWDDAGFIGYRSGVEKDSGATTLTEYGPWDIYIGVRKSSTDASTWKGAMDQMMVWERNLTTSEIAEIYNSNNTKFFEPTDTFSSTGTSVGLNLSAIWNFNDGMGTVALDSSGNSNDATMDNQQVWIRGYVPSPEGDIMAKIWESLPGVENAEAGTVIFGNSKSRTTLSGQSIRFNTSRSERMIITPSGLVGIGIESPTEIIDILGSFKMRDTGDSHYSILTTTSLGNTQLINTNAGTFDIKGTAPQLRFVNSSGAQLSTMVHDNSNFRFTGFVGNVLFNSQAIGKDISFTTENIQAMRIDSDQKVSFTQSLVVGKDDYISAHKLNVIGSANITGELRLEGTSSTALYVPGIMNVDGGGSTIYMGPQIAATPQEYTVYIKAIPGRGALNASGDSRVEGFLNVTGTVYAESYGANSDIIFINSSPTKDQLVTIKETTGHVGIGTSNPISRLEVNGGVCVYGGACPISPAPYNGTVGMKCLVIWDWTEEDWYECVLTSGSISCNNLWDGNCDPNA